MMLKKSIDGTQKLENQFQILRCCGIVDLGFRTYLTLLQISALKYLTLE